MATHTALPASATGLVDILAIDDNPNNLLVLCGMLKERGYRVRPATSGRFGLEAAESLPPDLILLDVNMPDMDGYEVCRELKKRDALRQIPVIFLSALGESVDKLRAFESGGFDYITKPFKIEEVVARIDTHVTIRRLRQDLEHRYAELQEAERLREKLIHLIIHDLRNPQAVVVSGLDFVLHVMRSQQDPTALELLEAAFRQASLVNRMIDDLLDIARFEGNKMPVKPRRHGIAAIVEEAQASVVLRGRQLALDLAGAPAEAEFDGDLVRRVLTNLLGNAAKFTPDDGSILLAVKQTPDGLRFEVRDDGPGIPAEYQERIFEKFGQVENAQPVKGRSSGLGLTFCRLAVEAQGGRIGVESDAGQGSLFWFTLPGEAVLLPKAA